MISVAPGVERYLLIYWPVQLQLARFGWFGGGGAQRMGGHDMMLGDVNIFKTGRRVGSLKENSYFEGQTSYTLFFLVMSVRNQLEEADDIARTRRQLLSATTTTVILVIVTTIIITITTVIFIANTITNVIGTYQCQIPMTCHVKYWKMMNEGKRQT